MTRADDVNPYDARAVQKYATHRRIDRLRREFVGEELRRLKFEYGTEHLSPYDLGQVARVREIFEASRRAYNTGTVYNRRRR